MSKYQYHQVESLYDLDLTFETKYYWGVGHEEVKSLQEMSLNGIQSMIDDKVLYTRTETPWYENIPEHGVLCWVDQAGMKTLRKVYGLFEAPFSVQSNKFEHGIITGKKVQCEISHWSVESCTPLTNDEIKKFLREEG